jgi:hypothetical protein
METESANFVNLTIIALDAAPVAAQSASANGDDIKK